MGKKRISFTFPKVKAMLESDMKYRNNDEILVTKYWWTEMVAMGVDGNVITAKAFFLMYREGKFTTEDVITRARRKCNEEYPHTRGLSYKPRKAKVKDVIAEIQTLSRGATP